MSPDMHAHSLAYAEEVVGICRGSRWHMPWKSMAYAVEVVGICRTLK